MVFTHLGQYLDISNGKTHTPSDGTDELDTYFRVVTGIGFRILPEQTKQPTGLGDLLWAQRDKRTHDSHETYLETRAAKISRRTIGNTSQDRPNFKF